jgi:hypothetical protein
MFSFQLASFIFITRLEFSLRQIFLLHYHNTQPFHWYSLLYIEITSSHDSCTARQPFHHWLDATLFIAFLSFALIEARIFLSLRLKISFSLLFYFSFLSLEYASFTDYISIWIAFSYSFSFIRIEITSWISSSDTFFLQLLLSFLQTSRHFFIEIQPQHLTFSFQASFIGVFFLLFLSQSFSSFIFRLILVSFDFTWIIFVLYRKWPRHFLMLSSRHFSIYFRVEITPFSIRFSITAITIS